MVFLDTQLISLNVREQDIKWKNRLDRLFHVAHVDTNEIITNKKYKEFLSLQRAGIK